MREPAIDVVLGIYTRERDEKSFDSRWMSNTETLRQVETEAHNRRKQRYATRSMAPAGSDSMMTARPCLT
jgi:hypothetical protein